ncbi:MAG: glycosyltransferase family 4 protein [Nitrospirota bacterium]|nr:glycosyltransferase family 4 protein [Nitrospirota bacterium]
MRPLNVLHLRDTHEIGGPGKTILETHRAIARERFRLHLGVFLIRGESGESPFTAEARRLEMPVHFLRGFNQYDPRLIGRVIDLVKTLPVDIVHAHEVKSDVITYLASQLHSVPIVTTLHGWIGNGFKQRVLTAIDKRLVGRFDRVIAVSKQIERDLVGSGVPPEKIRLLHNAIVIERYRRTGRRGVLTEVVGRSVSSPVIASIGRLSAEKGHADLIDAIGIVSSRGHKVSLVLIGDGPERPKLCEQIRALGLEHSVHLPGYIRDPQRMLEDIDLMVLPSHTEGLPNAALEALLMEVPVLATRVGGTPEVITDGETGRLVPAHSPAALAAGILEFLAAPEVWKRMAGRGQDMVKKNFDFQVRTRKLEAIYVEMMMGQA